MIKNISEDTINITAFDKKILKVVYRGKIVWDPIRSCFGSGYWINDRSWSNSDGWKN